MGRGRGWGFLACLLPLAIEDDLRRLRGLVDRLLGRLLAKNHGFDGLAKLRADLLRARPEVEQLRGLLRLQVGCDEWVLRLVLLPARIVAKGWTGRELAEAHVPECVVARV